jgi:hypothetical protein
MKIIVTEKEDGKKDVKKTYNLAQNWDNVTLGQYMEMMGYVNHESMTDTYKAMNCICILTGMTMEQAKKIQANSLEDLMNAVSGLLNTPTDEKLHHLVEIDGVEYGFHPKLSDITLGEFADLESYIKDGVDDNLDKILTVLYRPVEEKKGDKYRIAKYEYSEEKVELFKKKFNVNWVAGASVFFLSLGLELSTDLLTFLRKRRTRALKRHTDRLTSSVGGGGSQQYTT